MSNRPPTTYEILVVCTGNICRSPMAAGLLRHNLPDELRPRMAIGSAGTSALHGHQAAPYAVQTMAEAGIDISDHRARQVSSELVRRADLILTMERAHQQEIRQMMLWNKSHVKLLSKFDPHCDVLDVPDPYGGPLEAYRQCLEIIQPCVNWLIAWLSVESAMDVR